MRFDNKKTFISYLIATAMGEYYFTGLDGSETKSQYTFQYRRAADGSLEDRRPPPSVPLAAASRVVCICISGARVLRSGAALVSRADAFSPLVCCFRG